MGFFRLFRNDFHDIASAMLQNNSNLLCFTMVTIVIASENLVNKKVQLLKWQLNWFSDKSVIPSLTSNFGEALPTRLKRCVMLTNRKWWISISSKLACTLKSKNLFFIHPEFKVLPDWNYSHSSVHVCACVAFTLSLFKASSINLLFAWLHEKNLVRWIVVKLSCFGDES